MKKENHQEKHGKMRVEKMVQSTLGGNIARMESFSMMMRGCLKWGITPTSYQRASSYNIYIYTYMYDHVRMYSYLIYPIESY